MVSYLSIFVYFWLFQISGEYYTGYGTVLYGQNRRYLPQGHALRTEMWGNDGTENRSRPDTRRKDEYLDSGRRVQAMVDQLHDTVDPARRKTPNKDLTKLTKETGKKGLEEFARLPDYEKMKIPQLIPCILYR